MSIFWDADLSDIERRIFGFARESTTLIFEMEKGTDGVFRQKESDIEIHFVDVLIPGGWESTPFLVYDEVADAQSCANVYERLVEASHIANGSEHRNPFTRDRVAALESIRRTIDSYPEWSNRYDLLYGPGVLERPKPIVGHFGCIESNLRDEDEK